MSKNQDEESKCFNDIDDRRDEEHPEQGHEGPNTQVGYAPAFRIFASTLN
jgi:hypothetical protein